MANIIGIIMLLLLLGGFAGLIVLQVKLSRKEATMPGLILPIISFVIAMFYVVSVMFLTVRSTGGVVVREEYINENGEYIVEEYEPEELGVTASSKSVGIAFLPLLIMPLVPCIVFIIIYFACHPSKKKRAKQAELNKMSINDL